MTKHVLTSADGRVTLRWAVDIRAKTVGQRSGDGYTVLRNRADVFLGVSDGTGSGIDAAHATEQCLAALAAHGSSDLERVFAHVHEALTGTRGAAMAFAHISLDQARLTWAAVGDIDGIMIHRSGLSETLIQRGGTLGHNHPGVVPQSCALTDGDLIILTSDGVSRQYRNKANTWVGAQQTVPAIMNRYAKSNDDSIAFAAEVSVRE